MPTTFVSGPRGQLEVLTTGSGSPLTVFAHGLGASIASTRPYASAVTGTKVFFHSPSHGKSDAATSGWTYRVLAEELLAVTQSLSDGSKPRAVGVSMGAGAILSALIGNPNCFERVVLSMPAVVEDARDSDGLLRYDRLADASRRGDTEAIKAALAPELPHGMAQSDAGLAWLDEQSRAMAAPGMASALAQLPHQAPVTSADDARALQALSVPVLILAQEDDPVHPVASAQRLAEIIPGAQLEVFDGGGILFAHRARTRQIITEFLNG